MGEEDVGQLSWLLGWNPAPLHPARSPVHVPTRPALSLRASRALRRQRAGSATRLACPPGCSVGPREAPGMGSGKALLLPTKLAPASLVGSQRPRFTDEGSGTPGVVGRARANSTHRPALPASCVLLSGGLVPWASCCLCQWHSGPGWTRRGHSAFESVWSLGTEQLCAHLCPGSEQVA